MEYNDKNSNKNETLPLLKTTEVMAGNLNLQRLFVLTGSTTASASELIINSLRSYLDVRVIGKQTFGKTVGMTIYNESKKYGWIDRKSTRLNSSHASKPRMPSSA